MKYIIDLTGDSDSEKIVKPPKKRARGESKLYTETGEPLRKSSNRQYLKTPVNNGITVKESPIEGKGLFATEDFSKGQVLCSYGGDLEFKVDVPRKNIPSTYIVELEKGGNGRVIVGDHEDGDVGLYANSVVPGEDDTNKLNAKLDTDTAVFMIEKGKWRARFAIKAKKEIPKGAEILVDYGKAYWKNFHVT